MCEGDEEEIAGETQTMFDINLNMLIDCLTIYGISVSTSSSTGGTWKNRKRRGDEEERVQGPMDDFLASLGSKKRKTSMRMSYTGEGYPLKLLLCVRKKSTLSVLATLTVTQQG
jgi:hypothetical protein